MPFRIDSSRTKLRICGQGLMRRHGGFKKRTQRSYIAWQSLYFHTKLILASHLWAQQLLCWMLVSAFVFVKLFGPFFFLDLFVPQRFRTRNVYCVDFEVAEPPESWRVTRAQTLELLKQQNGYKEESIKFMNRLLGEHQSGCGQETPDHEVYEPVEYAL